MYNLLRKISKALGTYITIYKIHPNAPLGDENRFELKNWPLKKMKNITRLEKFKKLTRQLAGHEDI